MFGIMKCKKIKILMINRFKINNIFNFLIKNKYLILIWILFTSVEPFQFYSIIPYHPYKFLVFLITSIFILKLIKRNKKINFDFFIIVISLQALYSLLTIFIHYASLNEFSFSDGGIYLNLFLQLIVILILYIFIDKFYNFEKFSISFIYVLFGMTILGTIGVVLIYSINLQPFSYSIREGNRDISNFILTFATGKIEDNFLTIIRSSGYFDEPGTFAFYIIIALLLNKLYGYSKKIEISLMILGFCTISLAFLVSIFLYILVFSIIDKKYFFLIFLFGLMSSLFLLIYTLKDEDPVYKQLYELTIYRIQMDDTDSGQKFNGDNRSENIIYAYKAFINAPLFGYGMNGHVNPKSEFYGKICCNPYHPLATEGIIGVLIFFLLFISWFFIIFKNGNIDFISLSAWFILLINLIQRPGFLNGPFGYFVYILLIKATLWRKDTHNSNFFN
jgi:hypothetical protein